MSVEVILKYINIEISLVYKLGLFFYFSFNNEKDTFVKIMNQKATFLEYTSSIKICVFT